MAATKPPITAPTRVRRSSPLATAVALVPVLGASPSFAQTDSACDPIDYAKIERRIDAEPDYVAEPLYAMFVFGPKGQARMWAVLDKSAVELEYYDVLYLDKDCDGDLTEPDERFTARWSERGARAGMAVTLRVGDLPVPGTELVHEKFLVSTVRKKDRSGIWFRMQWNGEHEMSGGYGPVGTDVTEWARSPRSAPILRPNPHGPLSFALYGWGEDHVALRIGKADKVYVMAGSAGSGPDTLAVVDEEFLDLALDELWVTLIAEDADGNELRSRARLDEHC